MNYLGKRSLEEKCPFCGNKFFVTKHINEYIKQLDKNLSFYQFTCVAEDHVLRDYVSLYLNTTFYRRVTCTHSPDCIQLHLDFTKSESEITVEVNNKRVTTTVRFDYLLEDCNDIDKLLERLEIYQAFS